MKYATPIVTAGLALALALGAEFIARAADPMPDMIPGAGMTPELMAADAAAPVPADSPLRPEVADGIRHLNARDYAGAVERLAAAVASDPTDAAARYYLGYAYYRKGDFTEARAAFAAAYQADPHYSPTPTAEH